MHGTTGATRLDEKIDQLFDELGKKRGGHKNDYYGLIFLEAVHGIPRNEAFDLVAFGGNDFGIDGFFLDHDEHQFHLFQFKNSTSPGQFRESMERIAQVAIPALFSDSRPVADSQPIIDAARRALRDAKTEIEQVFIDFVFRGDPAAAERSEGLTSLKDEIEEKSWVLESYFDRPVSIVVRYLRFDEIKSMKPTDRFDLTMSDTTSTPAPME